MVASNIIDSMANAFTVSCVFVRIFLFHFHFVPGGSGLRSISSSRQKSTPIVLAYDNSNRQ